jgi:rhomboid protease GluP
MFKRQRTGSVVCTCGSLVGVNDEQCYSCGRRNPGLWGYAGLLRMLGGDIGFFVTLIMYGCTGLFAIALLLSVRAGGDIMGGGNPIAALSPSFEISLLLGMSGAVPVFVLLRWWTLLSAGWLHANVLHLIFNMLGVRNLAPATADIFGAPRMIIIYTVSCAAGFFLSSAAGLLGLPKFGAPYTLGASAPIFGLLGAVMHYGRRSGSSIVQAQAKGYALSLFIFGFIMPGVDNAAHAGGFIGGYLASMWLDPMKPQTPGHLLGALICLVLTALSIIASIVTLFPYLARS